MKGDLIKLLVTIFLGVLILAIFYWLLPDLKQNIPADAFKI